MIFSNMPGVLKLQRKLEIFACIWQYDIPACRDSYNDPVQHLELFLGTKVLSTNTQLL